MNTAIKYEDLRCEFCDGNGETEKFVEPYGDSPITCSFCSGTGIDEDQVKLLFRDKIQSLHKGESNDLLDKGWNEAIEHITKNVL